MSRQQEGNPVVRRIFLTGIGGMAGGVLWVVFSQNVIHTIVWSWKGLLLSILSSATVVVTVGEKLRIVPTQEQLDRQSRPISIFPKDD